MSVQNTSEGNWAGGWLVAVLAGVIAAVLSRWLGDVAGATAVVAGGFVFLVHAVLLGLYWTPPPAGQSGGHGHGHDGHGH